MLLQKCYHLVIQIGVAFIPLCTDQVIGYQKMLNELKLQLTKITVFRYITPTKPGAQGEYAGLMVIRAYHKNQNQKTKYLFDTSFSSRNKSSFCSYGWNGSSGYKYIQKEILIGMISTKSKIHKDSLAALMITYPSTHGVFENQNQRYNTTYSRLWWQV